MRAAVDDAIRSAPETRDVNAVTLALDLRRRGLRAPGVQRFDGEAQRRRPRRARIGEEQPELDLSGALAAALFAASAAAAVPIVAAARGGQPVGVAVGADVDLPQQPTVVGHRRELFEDAAVATTRQRAVVAPPPPIRSHQAVAATTGATGGGALHCAAGR